MIIRSTKANFIVSIALSMIMLSSATTLSAGIHVGNGGDVVVCYTNDTRTELKKVELLDHFEATTILRGLAPELGDSTGPGDSYRPMLDHVLTRIRKHSPSLANQLGAYVNDFINHAEFIDEGGLVDVPDSHHVVIPHNCEIKQIALQRVPRFPEEPRYLVDESLFHRLELPSRAMLAIHEGLYRIALEHGQVHSLNVRYLTAYVSSSKPDRDSTQEFMDILTKAGFGIEFWHDAQEELYWALFEKGIESPALCHHLAGEFHAPSVRELSAHIPRLLSSPLERFLFANGAESIVLWTGEFDSVRRDCPGSGRGTNAYKTVVIDGNNVSVGWHCLRSTGPFLLCLER